MNPAASSPMRVQAVEQTAAQGDLKPLALFVCLAFAGIFLSLAFPQLAAARASIAGLAGLLLLVLGGITLRDWRATGRPFAALVYRSNFKSAVLVQALVQGSVYLWWASHQPMALEHLPSLLVQMLFAPLLYLALCMLCQQPFRPGFWLVAVNFSINFFLWFKIPFLWAQLLLLALAILIKMFVVRAGADGKVAHIFNPSGIVLSLGSLAILLFGLDSTAIGSEIVTSFYQTPSFGLFVFAASCVTLWLPSSYLVPVGALAFLTLADVIAKKSSGMSLMVLTSNSSIFLGITLLITDPSTSPKTQKGRLLFGIAYGFSIAFAYGLLMLFHKPSYFDKVLFVPVLNLLAPWFDKLPFPKLPTLTPARLRIALLAAYLAMFGVFYPRFQFHSRGPFLLKAAAEEWALDNNQLQDSPRAGKGSRELRASLFAWHEGERWRQESPVGR